MPTLHRPSLVVVLATASLAAQDLPKPGPELARLEVLVGSWQGAGEIHEAGKTTKWRASGHERWVLGGFWLQGDWQIEFAGNPQPMHQRSFRGWDPERRTYVALGVDSGGGVHFDDLAFESDGTLAQIMLRHQHGMSYAMRSNWKVDGERLLHTIDVLTGAGASLHMIDGAFERIDAEPKLTLPTWAPPGHEPGPLLQKLALWAGSHDVKGRRSRPPARRRSRSPAATPTRCCSAAPRCTARPWARRPAPARSRWSATTASTRSRGRS
jgi:hypothetical protein